MEKQALSRELEEEKARHAETRQRLARAERRLEGQWEVRADDVHVLEELGRGRFGTVHRARWNGSDVAVKVVAPGASAAERAAAAKLLANEARTLARVRHINVVQMLGACREPPMLMMRHGGGH